MRAVIFGCLCFLTLTFGVYISNLNEKCLRCLCHVAGCNVSRGCSDGYCGPYFISRVYWAEAGKPTLPDDDPDRREAYSDCARELNCSMTIVSEYLQKYAKDCNGDGVTDCFDFMMVNLNGRKACSTPLSNSDVGKKFLASYKQCQL